MKKFWVVMAAAVAVCVSGCIPNIEEKDADLGTESSPDDVQKAVDSATSNISIINAQVGQSVTYEENYRVESGNVTMTKRFKHELESLTQDSTSLQCTIKEDLWTFTPSGDIKQEVHQSLDFRFRKNRITLSQFMTPKAASGTLCDGVVRDDGDHIKYDCLKYYNLKFESRQVDAPTAVHGKTGCMGLDKCQIDGYYVEYDQVKFLSNQVVRRVKLMAHLTSQVPDLYYMIDADKHYVYTPAATSFCTMSLEKIEENKYLVTMCTVLRDFENKVSPAPTPSPKPSLAN
jgi:hypothetical protein